MALWKYNNTTGFWDYQRDTLKETEKQWLKVFEKQCPNDVFKISKSKPKTKIS
jgi:hypothetical protein